MQAESFDNAELVNNYLISSNPVRVCQSPRTLGI